MLDDFKAWIGQIEDINSVQGLLGWDLETYMPPKGASIRAMQMATLATLSHEMLTSDKTGGFLQHLRTPEVHAGLSSVDHALVREVGKRYDREKKIPARLVEALTKTTAEAHTIWVQARENRRFQDFAPTLETIVALNREMAEAIGYEGSPYNALLDLYEPGLTTAQVEGVFETLKQHLVPLVHAIQNSGNQPDTRFLENTFDADKQWSFTLEVLKAMGFDFEAGRQDRSAHPFTMGMGPGDVRLTTRVHPEDLFSALFSSIHEGGHGLYEQGIDLALARTPLNGGASLGIHESQSRLWENLVGRSQAFWTHFYPRLQALFPDALQTVSPEVFYRGVNRVKPSLIRVEADEVTYNLHILLRFEIEKQVIEGSLAVADIPEAWNAKMEAYLGIRPDNDAEGPLQDVHWSHGSFGYFPTYTLGNLYSAQFFRQAQREIPDLEGAIAQGHLLLLKAWLNEKVHRLSKVETPEEIVQRVTGESLNPQYFTDYLWQKYGALYGVQRPLAGSATGSC